MKIALIYDAIYPDIIGGGEKRNWEIARRLVRRGHEVWLVGMQFWPGEAVIRREGVVCAGVCPAIPLFNGRGKRSIIEPLYFAWHLFKFLRHQRFDLIDCAAFPYVSCLVAKCFASMRRVPLIITWYEIRGWRGWWAYSGWAGLLAYIFEIGVAHLTCRNVAISPLTLVRAKRIFPVLRKNMTLIGCGADLPQQATQQSEGRKICRLLYLGRLVAHKRVNWLIDILRELTPAFPDLSLLIVGQGTEKNALVNQANRHGLRSRVVFRDFLSSDELRHVMECSDILVFPSEQEGFGLVIIEAMGMGLPVVAADAPLSAARMIIEEGHNGLLRTSSQGMADAVRRLLTDEKLFCRLVNGGILTAARHDWDSVIIPELEAYYKKMRDM